MLILILLLVSSIGALLAVYLPARQLAEMQGALEAKTRTAVSWPSRSSLRSLSTTTPFTVNEARDGDVLVPGQAWLAPGDHHLSLHRAVAIDGAWQGTVVVQCPTALVG